MSGLWMPNGTIKCPECGKDISNTSEKCIHCGFPIEKPKKKNWIKAHRKIVIFICVAIVVTLGIIFALTKGKSLLPHTIQNPKLIQLLEYTSPDQIKNELGDGFEHKTFDSINSTADDYNEIDIDGKTYSLVEISYKEDGTFERLYLSTASIWTEEDYKALVEDLIKQYGDEYNYKEDEYNGKPIYDYSWKIHFPRRISCSIHADEKGKYWVRINSFHN